MTTVLTATKSQLAAMTTVLVAAKCRESRKEVRGNYNGTNVYLFSCLSFRPFFPNDFKQAILAKFSFFNLSGIMGISKTKAGDSGTDCLLPVPTVTPKAFLSNKKTHAGHPDFYLK